jgi:hypothetical protein
MTHQQKLRTAAAVKQDHCCFYCGFPMWHAGEGEAFARVLSTSQRLAAQLQGTAEHLTAKTDGGRTTAKNIVAVCLTCNRKRHQRKSPQDPDAYKAHVQGRLARGAWHPHHLHAAVDTFLAAVAHEPSRRPPRAAAPPPRTAAGGAEAAPRDGR